MAKSTYLIVLILFLSYNIFGQKKLDSTLNLYHAEKNDSIKMELAHDICTGYFGKGALDSALIYNSNAQKLASQLNYSHKSLEYLHFDSRIYYRKDSLIKAFEILDSLFNQSQRLDNDRWMINALNQKGDFYSFTGKSKEAIQTYMQAESVGLKYWNNALLSTTYNNMSIEYQLLGDEETCAEYLIKSIELREKLNSPYLGVSYANLANSYKRQERFNEAIERYKMAIELLNDPSTIRNRIVCLRNLADTYTRIGQYNKARKNFKTVYNLTIEYDNSFFPMAMYYFLMSSLLQENERYDSALVYGNKVVELIPTGVAQEIQSSNLINMANACLAKGEILTAIEYGEKSKELAHEINSYKQLKEVAYLLLKAYGEAKNLEKTYENAELYAQSMDSLRSIEQAKQVIAMQTKYEVEKKKNEIKILSLEAESNRKTIESANRENALKNRGLIVISLVLLLLLLLAVFLKRQVNLRKKANNTLAGQKETIEAQNEERELLLKEIHHRIKNNLQVISSLLELQAKKVSDAESEVFKEGQSRVRAMALIHEELYQNNDLAEVDFKAYSAKLSRQIQSLFPGKEKVTISIEGPMIKLDIDTAIPLGLILNELVTNSFKYGLDEKGQLSIVFKEIDKGNYSVSVSDNGQGLAEDFDYKKSKSLGLRLVHRLTKQLYGKVEYSYNENSTFEISFKDTIERKKVA
ncbi:MAG: tetratricopeptide repeat-containing sensor histidine kinase [Bacteroidia bacterium]